MAFLASDKLFGGGGGNGSTTVRGGGRGEAPCSVAAGNSFRNMFGLTYPAPAEDQAGAWGSRIHPGPPAPTQSNYYQRGSDFVGGLSSPPSTSATQDRTVSGIGGGRDELMRWKVVKDDDAHRGFRMFDGILMSVKDVSSEELFIERMRIAYSAYEAYVSALVDESPLEIAKGLVRAVSACLVKYFSTQSMLRTNRPFIAKVLNLESPDMFCTHSEFVRSYLFTNASAEDEAVIALAEKVYADNGFELCDGGDTVTGGDSTGSGGGQLFDIAMRIAESRVVGGTAVSYGSRRDRTTPSHFATLSDELPFQHRREHGGGGTTAMLITVTDFEALHNYVAYVMYLTPVRLGRRYDVNFDSLRRQPSSDVNADCRRAREAKKRKGDDTKVVIRAVIEKKRREKIDTIAGRGAACEAGLLKEQVAQTRRRNHDLLSHVLLMLFDKCLTGVIDKGFENLNRRRGYASNSAKEIGTATIYTGIIDTVGEVTSRVDGYTFDHVVGDGDVNKERDNDNSAGVGGGGGGGSGSSVSSGGGAS